MSGTYFFHSPGTESRIHEEMKPKTDEAMEYRRYSWLRPPLHTKLALSSEGVPFVLTAYNRTPLFPRNIRKIAGNRLKRKEGGRDSGGGTLRCGVTIYDGLAGTYLGQRLLSVAREREGEKGGRNRILLFPAHHVTLRNRGSDQSF